MTIHEMRERILKLEGDVQALKNGKHKPAKKHNLPKPLSDFQQEVLSLTFSELDFSGDIKPTLTQWRKAAKAFGGEEYGTPDFESVRQFALQLMGWKVTWRR